MHDWVIDCLNLVNLEIMTSVVFQECWASFRVGECDDTLWDVIGYMSIKPIKNMKKYFGRVNDMFPGLCNARILTLDTIKVNLFLFLLMSLVHFQIN